MHGRVGDLAYVFLFKGITKDKEVRIQLNVYIVLDGI